MVRDRPLVDGRVERVDRLLAAIPLALLVGVGGGLAGPVPQVLGVGLGGAAAAALVGYAVGRLGPAAETTPSLYE